MVVCGRYLHPLLRVRMQWRCRRCQLPQRKVSFATKPRDQIFTGLIYSIPKPVCECDLRLHAGHPRLAVSRDPACLGTCLLPPRSNRPDRRIGSSGSCRRHAHFNKVGWRSHELWRARLLQLHERRTYSAPRVKIMRKKGNF